MTIATIVSVDHVLKKAWNFNCVRYDVIDVLLVYPAAGGSWSVEANRHTVLHGTASRLASLHSISFTVVSGSRREAIFKFLKVYTLATFTVSSRQVVGASTGVGVRGLVRDTGAIIQTRMTDAWISACFTDGSSVASSA